MDSNFLDLPQPPPGKTDWPWENENLPSRSNMPDGSPWPKISIVTPSLNQGQYLEETIRSVLLQNYPNLEYIIFDGGSTDNSIDIIHKYEPWISLWVSKPDRGQSHAINQGFRLASGEILAWLNSDDVLAPGALDVIAEHLTNEEFAFLVGASIITDNSYTLKGLYDCRQPTWEQIFFEGRTYPQPSVFWTRDLWEKVGALDEDLYFAMDYDLWLKMHPHVKKFVFLREVLSFARIHPNQKTEQIDRQLNNLYKQQRGQIIINYLIQQGKSPFFWLLNSYRRRCHQAYRMHSPTHLRPSEFQKAVFYSCLSLKHLR